ncbi:hypothetical protein [Poseidonibacter lekithochrous]|uniref:hypothetical protein n=1 Tax=Poseidonibacter lekithochrous TaxID=1904463 RepID=UPI000D3B8499|nr:hypothetical protein [Poseidonibacter lekithochrous]
MVTFKEIKEEFIDFNNECDKLNFYTRTKKNHSKKIEECEEYVIKIKEYKKQAIKSKNEFEANELLHIQCIINAHISFFTMWINLKEEDFQTAWIKLIDASEYISVALKINDYKGVRNFQERIKSAELSIFPNFALFNSPGLKETVGKCSICLENFILCNHIENNIYMGRLCQRVDRQILEVNHVAFVKKPRDKRCIITAITEDNGEEIDYLTLEKTGNVNSIKDGMPMKAIVFKIPNLDFN